MAEPPRPSRGQKGAIDVVDEALISRLVVRRRDPRQAVLFRTAFVPPFKPALATKPPHGRNPAVEMLRCDRVLNS